MSRVLALAFCLSAVASAEDRPAWDQGRAVAKVQQVLDVEAAGRAWNDIAWVTDAATAACRAKAENRPILVWFYLRKEATGPRDAPCCAGGRITRAVVLSDPRVRAAVEKDFVPFKLEIREGTDVFPSDWPAIRHWNWGYQLTGGEECRGITGCAAVSPDLEFEYADTGSCLVWELFDTAAYDAEKFLQMLADATRRFEQEQAIRAHATLADAERAAAVKAHRRAVRREVKKEGRFHLPPAGFTIEGAKELFRLSGDLPADG